MRLNKFAIAAGTDCQGHLPLQQLKAKIILTSDCLQMFHDPL